MIVRSTPSAISWSVASGDVIKFYGEWTLEPVFYLSREYEWIPNKRGANNLSKEQIAKEREQMIKAADARGWIVREEKNV